MRSARSVVTVHPSADVVPLGRFSLHDLDTLRLVLRGSSVIDWYRLHFKDSDEIDAFVRANELDPQDRDDCARIEEIRKRAIDYLKEHLRYRIPEVIQQPQDVRTLFEYASGKGRRAHRLHACLVLKVMHIIQYVDAHELLSMLPMSNAELNILLQAKIERVVRGLIERNFPIEYFTGNTKTHYSVLSKLLAKKDTQAAQIFDRLRFRFVVRRLEDIPPLLIALSRELMPFNYLVPSQSENSLVDMDRMLVRAGNLEAIRASKGEKADLNELSIELEQDRKNEFSGPNYRVVNFVAEVPLRVDRVLSVSPRHKGLGSVVFGTVEFQVVDKVTERSNEIGENRHSMYKLRQRRRVKERLERGKRKKEQNGG